MSGLTKPKRDRPVRTIAVTASEIAPINPLLELTQPGGPYPPGHALLTDGMGGYDIESTFRPYFLSFAVPSAVPKLDTAWVTHHGISTETCGPVIPLSANVIALSISVTSATLPATVYLCELLARSNGKESIVGSLELLGSSKRAWRRDLSIHLDAGTELAVRVRQTEGHQRSRFSGGIIMVELEN